MAKTIFEQMGGTYTQAGDYFLPQFETARGRNASEYRSMGYEA